ncbi:thiosulfate dehydrogenase [Methylosinus sp. sav-2]|uniref:cytochrome c n=1 Tax=unclassified Methylosinus TaxID=2624500 RepID=UPI00046418F8|nr:MULTISPECIES: cytochrome c [unclassified Methylosinus]TDX64172.1 thiosulfate dehydrogenase [Methylosinus sp. sav-2]
MLRSTLLLAFGLAAFGATTARADEFTKTDVERYQKEFEQVAAKGRELWTSGALGTNGVACAQCHPNAANTHPETYPKFQKQLGKVTQLFEMVNWCIRNPLQGANLPPDDPRMTALVSYITFERRGVKLAPGQH